MNDATLHYTKKKTSIKAFFNKYKITFIEEIVRAVLTVCFLRLAC